MTFPRLARMLLAKKDVVAGREPCGQPLHSQLWRNRPEFSILSSSGMVPPETALSEQIECFLCFYRCQKPRGVDGNSLRASTATFPLVSSLETPPQDPGAYACTRPIEPLQLIYSQLASARNVASPRETRRVNSSSSSLPARRLSPTTARRTPWPSARC